MKRDAKQLQHGFIRVINKLINVLKMVRSSTKCYDPFKKKKAQNPSTIVLIPLRNNIHSPPSLIHACTDFSGESPKL